MWCAPKREMVSPSGKGIDVSLVLHELGAATLAISLNAGLSGKMLAELLAERKLPCRFVAAEGQTRVAALITDLADGRQSTVLAPTLTAGPQHLAALADQVRAQAGASWGLVCAGSLPPGLPLESWAQLLALGQELGLVTLLDSSGPGLRQGIQGLPHILKINGRELAELAEAAQLVLPSWRAPDQLKDRGADFASPIRQVGKRCADHHAGCGRGIDRHRRADALCSCPQSADCECGRCGGCGRGGRHVGACTRSILGGGAATGCGRSRSCGDERRHGSL